MSQLRQPGPEVGTLGRSIAPAVAEVRRSLTRVLEAEAKQAVAQALDQRGFAGLLDVAALDIEIEVKRLSLDYESTESKPERG